MNRPEECRSIEEVRCEIDRIDRAIIGLLSERLGYVREVVRYKKPTSEGINAAERRAAVIDSRRQWAANEGLDPDAIGEMYEGLIDYFIEEEKKVAQL